MDVFVSVLYCKTCYLILCLYPKLPWVWLSWKPMIFVEWIYFHPKRSTDQNSLHLQEAQALASPMTTDETPPVHKSFKMHKCPLCPKAYGLPSGLKIHLRSHAKEKLFSCPHCLFRTTDLGNLMIHASGIHKDFRFLKNWIKAFFALLGYRSLYGILRRKAIHFAR